MQSHSETIDPLLTLSEVMALTRVSKASIYAWAADDAFPKPLKFNRGKVFWLRSEVIAWRNGRPRAVLKPVSRRPVLICNSKRKST